MEPAGRGGRPLPRRLSIPSGVLVVGAGTEYVEGDAVDDSVRPVEVPAGEYRATVLTYFPSVNSEFCVRRAGMEEPIGTWFRRIGPGEDFPRWLAAWCLADPSHEPERTDEWLARGEE